MSIKSAYILAAGKGTRMGEIGKILPKPLMPLFERRLIDFHIESLKGLGIQNIYINSHHLHESLSKHIQENWSNTVVLLHEKELLDVGGAITNLKYEKDLNEKVLVTLSDMIFFYDKSLLNILTSKGPETLATLLAMKIGVDDNYNRLEIGEDSILKSINSDRKSSYTFSGLSLIDFSKVKPSNRPSKFFGGLINLQNNEARVVFDDSIEYFDFGKIDDYIISHREILKKFQTESSGNLLKFLVSKGFIDPRKIDSFRSYGKNNGLKLKEVEITFLENLVKIDSDNIHQEIELK